MRARIIGLGVVAALGYVIVIAAANAAIRRWGVVPVWPGVHAPVAVYFVGAALVLRDLVQVTLGRVAMLGALALGCLLSYLTADAKIAAASAAAFACSELIDFAGFTLVAPRWKRAVAVGGLAAVLVDSLVFLTVAPQLVPGAANMSLLGGQLIGKSYGIVVALLLIPVGRRTLAPMPAPAG